MLTWKPPFGIATGINIIIKPKLSASNSDRNIKKEIKHHGKNIVYYQTRWCCTGDHR